jgi:hypothetical protein
MDLMMRYNDGSSMGSGAGVIEYFLGHLQETKEAGGLAGCINYLSGDGHVRPEVHNLDLWLAAGWNPEKEELPPPELLHQLSRGYDREGRQLTQSRGFRQPKEMLITLPAELSESLGDHPETARAILRETVEAHLREVERKAVRIRMGGGKREWKAAKVLALYYIHAENRGGEIHYHAHVLTFAPAKDMDGTWRTWDNGKNVMQLSKPGGSREKATDAMLEAAKRAGLEVDLRRGTAAEAPGEAPGASVWTLDGQFIEAGSLNRKRRIEVLAAQEMKRELGDAVPLTPRELEMVRRLSGDRAVQDLSGERRRKALAEKLNKFGMLGKDGCILPKAELAEKLKGYEQKLAQAQVQLEAGVPGTGDPHWAAANLIQARREQVAAVTGEPVDLTVSAKTARIRWTKDYARVLEMVEAARGLRTEHLDKRDRNLLSKLKKAGLLEAQKVGGMNVYWITESGMARLCGATASLEEPVVEMKEPAVEVKEPAVEVWEPWSLRIPREIREYEASDPQDLRELVESWGEEVQQVFPEVALDVLQPVHATLELADGRLYPLAPIQVTREAIHEVVDGLETACLAAAETKLGRSFDRGHESQFVAETWFRAGYGLRPLEREDLERPWSERLGRLVRQGWDRLLDQACKLGERAREILASRAAWAWREKLRTKARGLVSRDQRPPAPPKPPKPPKSSRTPKVKGNAGRVRSRRGFGRSL